MDKYANFCELNRNERSGLDFLIRIARRPECLTTIVAPHGGAIEPGTSELAIAIAAEDINFACFDGIKNSGNGDLHITSTNFDEPEICGLVELSDHVLALHGERSGKDIAYVGGKDSELGLEIKKALIDAGFNARNDNPNLQGLADSNICNRGLRRRGVQLELTRGLRASLFSSLTSAGRKSPSVRFAEFVQAVRYGLRSGGAL